MCFSCGQTVNFLWLQEGSYSLANVIAVDTRGPDDASSLLGSNSITLNLSLGARASGAIIKDSRRHTQQGCSLLRQERKITAESGPKGYTGYFIKYNLMGVGSY